MEEIFTFIDNLSKRLARPIKDLDDVRGSMAALSEIREAEIRYLMAMNYSHLKDFELIIWFKLHYLELCVGFTYS